MIALLQRVGSARVAVAGETVGEIGAGLLVFLAVEAGDDAAQAKRLAERVVHYRVFPDGEGRMNRSLVESGGECLVVPQFTLAADTRKGLRPSFSTAAGPREGARLYDEFLQRARAYPLRVASGRFGAAMQVALVNDGPVTFTLRVAPPAAL